jgi:hypothetical protein
MSKPSHPHDLARILEDIHACDLTLVESLDEDATVAVCESPSGETDKQYLIQRVAIVADRFVAWRFALEMDEAQQLVMTAAALTGSIADDLLTVECRFVFDRERQSWRLWKSASRPRFDANAADRDIWAVDSKDPEIAADHVPLIDGAE